MRSEIVVCACPLPTETSKGLVKLVPFLRRSSASSIPDSAIYKDWRESRAFVTILWDVEVRRKIFAPMDRVRNMTRTLT
jgi:hypothetical protein